MNLEFRELKQHQCIKATSIIHKFSLPINDEMSSAITKLCGVQKTRHLELTKHRT